MTINERITKNILIKLNEMNNDTIFKERCPNIRAEEYLYAKVSKKIKIKRLTNILNRKAKRITLEELVCIADALNVYLYELVK